MYHLFVTSYMKGPNKKLLSFSSNVSWVISMGISMTVSLLYHMLILWRFSIDFTHEHCCLMPIDLTHETLISQLLFFLLSIPSNYYRYHRITIDCSYKTFPCCTFFQYNRWRRHLVFFSIVTM